MDVVKDRDCQHVEEHDLVTSYLAGRLSEDEAEAFEKHYFGCEKCWAEVKAGEEIRAALKGGAATPASSKVRRGPWSNWKLLAVAAAVGIAAAGGLLLIRSNKADVYRLAAALDRRSPVEGRLTGGFSGGPKQTQRSSSPSGVPATGEALEAIGRIKSRAEEKPTSANLAALGIAELAIGQPQDAIRALEAAKAMEPGKAQYWTDLAAAYLAAGEKLQRADLVANALAAAEQAISLDPSLNEARFNRALALENLSLREKARQAWEEYLQSDSDSAWAEEAKRRAARLSKEISRFTPSDRELLLGAARNGQDDRLRKVITRFPQEARETVEALLAAWADQSSRNPQEALRELTDLERLARAQTEFSGDPMLRDAVLVITSAARAQSGPGLGRLVAGHLAFRSGKTLYESDRIDEARKQFKLAHEELGAAKSPFLLWSSFYLAVCHYFDGNLDEALTVFEAHRNLAESNGYRLLRYRSEWMIGLIHAVRADFARSLTHYQKALEGFESLGEPGNSAYVHSLVAENFSYLGDNVAAWQHRRAALALLPRVGSQLARHAVIAEASYACLRDDLPWLGLTLLGAPGDNRDYDSTPGDRSESALLAAQLFQRVGRPQLALSCLARAREELAHIIDSNRAARDRAEILLSQGQIERIDRPHLAEKSLTAALSYFQKVGLHESRSPEIYLERGRAFLAENRPDLAENDFLAGIEAFERQRASQADFRIPYFERAWELFAALIRLRAITFERPDAALEIAERARARDLLAHTGEPSRPLGLSTAARSRPLDPVEIQSRLPPKTALVYYSVQTDQILVWLLSRDRLVFRVVPVPASQLALSVTEYRSAVEHSRPMPVLRVLAARLYDYLLRPVESFASPNSALIFIPDGPVHDVPLGSLIDRETGRYLVSAHPVGFAPSGTLFVRACEQAHERRTGRSPTALVVGNPTLTALASDLEDLPAAAEEAARVAELYNGSQLLMGRDATARHFRELASEFEIIHFAGHAVANNNFPELARLFFAPEPAKADDGTVFAYQLYEYSFPRAQLAVLAACQTGAGQSMRTEGVMSLVRPFLAAGVPSVVATLWRIPDGVSRELMLRFHQRLIAGDDALTALQQAQLALAFSPEASLQLPAAWAGYQVFGAGVSYFRRNDRRAS